MENISVQLTLAPPPLPLTYALHVIVIMEEIYLKCKNIKRRLIFISSLTNKLLESPCFFSPKSFLLVKINKNTYG